jgi:5-methylcytosine-specific restriction protein A
VYRAIDEQRGSTVQRGYDSTWRKLRAWFLKQNPLCWFCAQNGRVTAASVVDHIEPISMAPDRRLDHANLRSSCKPCHDRHTATEQGFARKGGGGRKV